MEGLSTFLRNTFPILAKSLFVPALWKISTVKKTTASIPLNCWKNSSAKPTVRGLITADEKNTLRVNRLGRFSGSSCFLQKKCIYFRVHEKLKYMY